MTRAIVTAVAAILVLLASGLDVRADQKVIRDAAEYNAYMSALSQKDPVRKAEAMEAFVQRAIRGAS